MSSLKSNKLFPGMNFLDLTSGEDVPYEFIRSSVLMSIFLRLRFVEFIILLAAKAKLFLSLLSLVGLGVW